jgi:hypothetical protein
MAKTRSNNRRAKASTRRKRGGLFGMGDIRGKMAKAMGKSEDAFKPDDMGIMSKANSMGNSMKEGAHSMGARAQQMMHPGQASATVAPVARGGRRRRRSTKKGKKSKKSKKSRKTRRRRH